MSKRARRLITVLLALLALGITPGTAHAILTRLGVPEGWSAVVSVVLGIVAAVAIVIRGWQRAEDFEQYVKAEEVIKAPEIGAEDIVSGTVDGGERDELYCGKGKDEYDADKNDHVDSSCEVKWHP